MLHARITNEFQGANGMEKYAVREKYIIFKKVSKKWQFWVQRDNFPSRAANDFNFVTRSFIDDLANNLVSMTISVYMVTNDEQRV